MRRLRLHVLRRRQYSVPGPNALWHIDGNHKLIRYVFFLSRLTVHLSIDALGTVLQ